MGTDNSWGVDDLYEDDAYEKWLERMSQPKLPRRDPDAEYTDEEIEYFVDQYYNRAFFETH